MQLVQTVTVGSGGATSIDFTNIPQDATDLLVLVTSRASTTDTLQVLKVEFNGSTTGYSNYELYGDGSNSTTQTRTFIPGGLVPDNGTTSNVFGNSAIYVFNYTTSLEKLTSTDSVSEAAATFAVQSIHNSRWTGTSAITSIKLLMNAGSFVENSIASLYKITKA